MTNFKIPSTEYPKLKRVISKKNKIFDFILLDPDDLHSLHCWPCIVQARINSQITTIPLK